MDYLSLTLIFFIISTAFASFLFIQERKKGKDLYSSSEENIALKVNIQNLNDEINKINTDLSAKKEEIKNLESQNSSIYTKLKLSEQKLTLQEEQWKEEKNHWEKLKDEHLQSAKASITKAGGELSNKLLDDHKREAEAQKKATEEKIKQETLTLHEKFEKVFSSMDKLHGQVKEVEVVRQALLTPSGAGNLGEITLENILKASNLIQDVDYFLQKTISDDEGNILKPDALIKLPNNSFIVVDSKSSKFILEMHDNDNGKEVEAKLKQSMNQHLKDLISKDYKSALEDSIKRAGEQFNTGNISYLMFLPTESSVETISKIDNKFLEKAWKENIIPVGPAGLVNHLLYSKMLISNSQQERNFKEISEEVKIMLGSIITLYDLSDKMGRSIKSSADKYDKFARSFNRNFISKVKRLDKMGISNPKNADLKDLELYRIEEVSKFIESNAEEIADDDYENKDDNKQKIIDIAS